MKALNKNSCQRARQRGAALPMVGIVVLVIIALAIAAWFLIVRPNRQASAPLRTVTAAAAAAAAAAATVAPPKNVAGMSVPQLLDEARNAVRAQRWVAPAGNNAFEFYLKVLQKDPNNAVARSALRESFTTGANAAEQSINAGNLDEAQREIGLLAKADPGNYTLTLLGTKLDAQRKLNARTEAQQAKQQATLAARQEAAAAAAAAPTPAPAAPAAPTTPANNVAATTTPAPVAPPPVVAPPPKPTPVGPTRQALLQHSVQPIAPRRAVAQHRRGWVLVGFTVNVQGNVVNAHVLSSQPGHLFDRAALKAVEGYKFKPALKNGVPVATSATQRITFNL